MTIISLLNLPMELPADSPAQLTGSETFLTNLKTWISRCQTYEGGIGGAPSNEAHGAYAFCALACLSIIDAPQKSIPSTLHIPSLISWLSSQQHAPESGFAGRTNKLVDGCYSHWVGGCWALLSAALNPTSTPSSAPPKDLWSRAGLARYILCCCQNLRTGGLRDKPSKFPDSYHTCYVLTGLSAAQNIFSYREVERLGVVGATAGFGWNVEERGSDDVPCEYMDRVRAVHPVFVVSFESVEEARRYFEEKVGF
jgi:protein farnesyltransferase subunit beta